MKCIQCHKEFEPKRADAKFDYPNCRKAYNRSHVTDNVDVTDNVTDNSFTPNWKARFDSKEHAIEGMLKSLELNREAILKHGVDQTATFILGDKIFTLGNRGFLKK